MAEWDKHSADSLKSHTFIKIIILVISRFSLLLKIIQLRRDKTDWKKQGQCNQC